MSKYIIIDAEAIQKRIEELENTEAQDRLHGVEIYRDMYILKQILSQSTPLIPEIEKAFNAGEKRGYEIPSFQMRGMPVNTENPNVEDYISNLKLDI